MHNETTFRVLFEAQYESKLAVLVIIVKITITVFEVRFLYGTGPKTLLVNRVP